MKARTERSLIGHKNALTLAALIVTLALAVTAHMLFPDEAHGQERIDVSGEVTHYDVSDAENFKKLWRGNDGVRERASMKIFLLTPEQKSAYEDHARVVLDTCEAASDTLRTEVKALNIQEQRHLVELRLLAEDRKGEENEALLESNRRNAEYERGELKKVRAKYKPKISEAQADWSRVRSDCYSRLQSMSKILDVATAEDL